MILARFELVVYKFIAKLLSISHAKYTSLAELPFAVYVTPKMQKSTIKIFNARKRLIFVFYSAKRINEKNDKEKK